MILFNLKRNKNILENYYLKVTILYIHTIYDYQFQILH